MLSSVWRGHGAHHENRHNHPRGRRDPGRLPLRELHAASRDQLSDLTGKAIAIVTLKGRDNFTSEYRYDVSIRNNSGDPLIGDSLVLVLDKITNLAGEDREALKNEPLLHRFEVLDQDGETDDGKPFFRIPAGSGPDRPIQ